MNNLSDKWYFKTHWLIIGFLCVGPFILPLVLLNPGYSRRKKIVISIIIGIVSYALGVLLLDSIKSIMAYYQFMFQQLENTGK